MWDRGCGGQVGYSLRISHTKRRGFAGFVATSVSPEALDHRAQIYRGTSRPITTRLDADRSTDTPRVRVYACATGRLASTFTFYALCKSARWPFANVDTVLGRAWILRRAKSGDSCRAFHRPSFRRAVSIGATNRSKIRHSRSDRSIDRVPVEIKTLDKVAVARLTKRRRATDLSRIAIPIDSYSYNAGDHDLVR